jgi:hypothetical protein
MPRFTGQNRKKNINPRYFLNETMETQENNLLKEESPELEQQDGTDQREQGAGATPQEQKQRQRTQEIIAFGKQLTPQKYRQLAQGIKKWQRNEKKFVRRNDDLPVGAGSPVADYAAEFLINKALPAFVKGKVLVSSNFFKNFEDLLRNSLDLASLFIDSGYPMPRD